MWGLHSQFIFVCHPSTLWLHPRFCHKIFPTYQRKTQSRKFSLNKETPNEMNLNKDEKK